MKVAYLAFADVYLLLSDQLDIVDVATGSSRIRPSADVKIVTGMHASPWGAPRLDGSYFITDGLGCIRLLWWIISENPSAARPAIQRKFARLFSTGLPQDVLRVMAYVMFGDGDGLTSEDQSLVGNQMLRHPRECEAIAALGAIARSRSY